MLDGRVERREKDMILLLDEGLSQREAHNMQSQSMASELRTDDIFEAKLRRLYVAAITRTLRRRHRISSTLRSENIHITFMRSWKCLYVLGTLLRTIGMDAVTLFIQQAQIETKARKSMGTTDTCAAFDTMSITIRFLHDIR